MAPKRIIYLFYFEKYFILFYFILFYFILFYFEKYFILLNVQQKIWEVFNLI